MLEASAAETLVLLQIQAEALEHSSLVPLEACLVTTTMQQVASVLVSKQADLVNSLIKVQVFLVEETLVEWL